MMDVELPLVEDQLQDIDSQIAKAETELSWKSDGKLTIHTQTLDGL